MAKILFVSDVHIGIRYPYHIDLRTGISQRTMDFVIALKRVVIYAIDNGIDIFVICGDLFDRVSIGPTLLRIVRELIWQPLIQSDIPVIVIGGNHDTPQILEKGTPFGELTLIPNWITVRIPQVHKIKTKSNSDEIGFILLPYMTATQAIDYVEKELGEEIPKEDQLIQSQILFSEWIDHQADKLETRIKIIVGHSYFQGSKIGIIPYPDLLPHEFQFNKEIIPLNKVDLVVFGHIHTHQVLYDGKVLIPGSLERVDYGEIGEDKGFYIFDTLTTSLNFIPNNARKLLKLVVEVPINEKDPTKYIIAKFLEKTELNESIFRLEIVISSHLQKKVRLKEIKEKIQEKTFHYEIYWHTQEEYQYPVILSEFILEPRALFLDYIAEKYEKYPYFKDLREKGLKILEEALSKVEETN